MTYKRKFIIYGGAGLNPFFFLMAFALALGTGTICNAQNDLQYYLTTACNHSAVLKESKNLVAKSRIDRSLIESQYVLPRVSLTANYMITPYFNNHGQLITRDPDPKAIGYDAAITNGGLYSALLNVEKPLFVDGVVSVFDEQTQLSVKNAENSYANAKHSLERDVTDQYLNVCQDQELFALARAIADTITVQLRYLEGLVQRGLAKQSDYLMLKIEADNQLLTAEQHMNDLKKDKNILNTLCGLQDTVSIQFSVPDLTYMDPRNASNFMTQFILDSSTIENQQKIFETKYKPQLSAFFNTGINALDLNDIQRKFGMSAGLNFLMPIYDGGQRNLTQQQSEILLRTVTGYRDNQQVILANNRKAAMDQIAFYKKNEAAITEQIRSYEQLLKIAQGELLNGQRSYLDYITLIRTYLELKKSEVAATTGYRLSVNLYNYWNW